MRTAILLGLSAGLVLAAQDPRLFAPSLARLKANDPKAAEDVAPGSPVERTALSPDMEKAPWTRQVQASEWLLRAHILRQRGQTAAPLAGARDPYLLRAWHLLEAADSQAARDLAGGVLVAERNPSTAARMPGLGKTQVDTRLGASDRDNYTLALEWIRLEVAWRLRDPARMVRALAPFPARKTLEGRELVHAFMTAAHAGDWNSFLRWGGELEASGQLERVRALARTDASLPDYGELLKQARRQAPAPGPGTLPAAAFQVKSMGLKLAGFRTGDKELAARLQASGAWAESGPLQAPLVRAGAVAHWLKPGTVPLALAGAMDAASLRLEGSADVALAGGTAWRKETWRLMPCPGAPNCWSGSLEVAQQALDGAVPPAQVFHLSYEVRLELAALP